MSKSKYHEQEHSEGVKIRAEGTTYWERYNHQVDDQYPVHNTLIEFTLNDDKTISGSNVQSDGFGGYTTKTYKGTYRINNDEDGIEFEVMVTFCHGAECIYKGTASKGSLQLRSTFFKEGGPFHLGDTSLVKAKVRFIG
ncbi:hypothetical protein AKO1_002350 [Acrasis kona]|uniref:DUF3224 domain-containing protein n=1 Tax=Acrasis kona TaxID=1008807 RepID=A0AAW2ZPI5_9EUKA